MEELRLLDLQWHAGYSTRRLDEFVERCHQRGVSVTPQRLAVIRALLASGNHPSAEEICVAVRKRNPYISLATVHRILEQFCQVGEARKVTALHGSARYDGHVEPHQHVFCVRCRRVQDVEMPEVNGLIKGVAHLGEFELIACSLEIEGICKPCRAKERKAGGRRAVPAGAEPVAARATNGKRRRASLGARS
jgi:Fur family transcriptional regulator, peroxide stress response regulator